MRRCGHSWRRARDSLGAASQRPVGMPATALRIVHIGRPSFAARPDHHSGQVTQFPRPRRGVGFGRRSDFRQARSLARTESVTSKFENGAEHDGDSAVRADHMRGAGQAISASDGDRLAANNCAAPRHRAHFHTRAGTLCDVDAR
jgi:hypothetical protein